MSAVCEENVYKLKEFGITNEGSAEARYNRKKESIEDLIKGVKIKIINIDEEKKEMEFDIIGIGAPITNAIRRILIAEVPTMAIDKVEMYNNTTIIPDEVLAHRLGLVPISVDPRVFQFKNPDDDKVTEEDTLVFELKVKCTRKSNATKDVCAPDNLMYNHSKVYSRDMKFLPLTNQQKMYEDIKPVHDDILLAVLKPGHEIDLKAYCFKNIGREHAKFSPVVNASYRLLPQIRLKEEIVNEQAHTLASCFPPGVIRISKKKDREVAKVNDARKCLCNRNVYLHEEFKESVEVSKIKDHYIFTVESAGALAPEILVTEAIDILREK
ncbi:DNA-directed RNA polymerases I and III subunit RPAC1, partial [Stegodyphus mimosarum]